MSRNVLRCRGIRKLQSLLLLGALSPDRVHVTTNAGFRKENDEKRQEEKKEKYSWQWLNRPARSGYIRVGIKRAISISLGTILEKRVRAPK